VIDPVVRYHLED